MARRGIAIAFTAALGMGGLYGGVVGYETGYTNYPPVDGKAENQAVKKCARQLGKSATTAGSLPADCESYWSEFERKTTTVAFINSNRPSTETTVYLLPPGEKFKEDNTITVQDSVQLNQEIEDQEKRSQQVSTVLGIMAGLGVGVLSLALVSVLDEGYTEETTQYVPATGAPA